jgi:hypothetical protein
MKKQPQRRVYLIDQEVQGGLLHKAAWYWLLSLAVVGSLNVIGWIFIAPGVDVLVRIRELMPSFFGVLLVAMTSSLIVLPVLLYDLTKYTNRFAGPVYRLERTLNALADGKTVQPLSFREGDYWHELAEAFNRVAARLETAEAAATTRNTEILMSYESADLEETSVSI